MTMSRELPFCVYVLKSLSDGLLYTGFTTDLSRRLAEHESGQSPATAPRRPFMLIFCEHYRSKKDAIRREQYFKTSKGKRALQLMLQDTMDNTDAGQSDE